MVDDSQQDLSRQHHQTPTERPRSGELRRYYRIMIGICLLIAAAVGAVARAFEAFLVAFGISAAAIAICALAFAGTVLVPSRNIPAQARRGIVVLLSVGVLLELASLVLASVQLSCVVTPIAGLVFVTAAGCIGSRLLTN
jgi:hypothetical protein